MEKKIEELLNNLKEPTLKYELVPAKDISPAIGSYLGGKPYMENDEKNPCCSKCKKVLTFVFQFFIPGKMENKLFAFYYCFHCEMQKGNKGFEMKVYTNPSLEKMKKKIRKNPLAEYNEFRFYPSWSLPDWDALELLNPELFSNISKEYKEDAWVIYESTKESIVGVAHMEPFSFYKGYPQFVADPDFPTCSCCRKKMKLFTQVDSFDEEGIVWGEMGCLYLFQCANGNDDFKFHIQ